MNMSDCDANDTPMPENFGFKSERAPPQHEDLCAFEKDLYEMARTVKFEYRPNVFQRRLANDVKTIKSSPTLYIPADKTTNLYKMDVKDYRKLLQENISAKYKKIDASNLKNINKEAKEIAEELKLDDRIERFPGK